MRTLPVLPIVFILATAPLAPAQFGDESTKGPRPDKEQTEKWEIGVVVKATNGPCAGIVGTVALPVDWPEQLVSIVAEDYSTSVVSHTERMVGAVKQLVLSIPELPAGEEARAVLTVEIRRRTLLPPADPSIFVKANPKKVPKEIRAYLGPSPNIEINNGKIKALAKELAKQSSGQTAWDQVAAIHRWIRENVKHESGKVEGAAHALKTRRGEHEDLTALFIALCRDSDIPARTVWMPKFCYGEFYLEDAEGEGYWLPCVLTGDEAFGALTDLRPIWQKGDNFKVPERPREIQRYVERYLTAKGVAKPEVKFIRQIIGGVP
jgi:hypothetical protein